MLFNVTPHVRRFGAPLPACALLAALTLFGCDPDTVHRGAEPRVAVEGAPLRGGGSGLFFDGRDRLWVATGAQSLAVMDPDTGEVLETHGPEVGVGLPDDLVVADDGTVYWTEIMLGTVRALRPDGSSFLVASDLFLVNPITMTEDGELYVAQCFGESNGLYRLDPTGQAPPEPILADIPGCAGNGMDSWEGELYVPRFFEDRIVRVDPATGEVSDVTTGFTTPTAVKFNSRGELFAVSLTTGEIVSVDTETGERTVVAVAPTGIDNLAFDSADRLFVSNPSTSAILEVTAAGGFRTVSAEGVAVPLGVTTWNGELVVSSFGALRGFDATSGDPTWTVHSPLLFTEPLPFPPAALTHDDSAILFTELFGGRVARFDPHTREVLAVSQPLGQLADVESLGDTVAVTDIATASIHLIDAATLELSSTLETGAVLPVGLAGDESVLYVSDAATGSVLRVIRDGRVLDAPEPLIDGALQGPEGMALTRRGRLVVVEAGSGRLVLVDPAQPSEVVTLAADLEFLPSIADFAPIHFLNNVEISSNDEAILNLDGTGSVMAVPVQ